MISRCQNFKADSAEQPHLTRFEQPRYIYCGTRGPGPMGIRIWPDKAIAKTSPSAETGIAQRGSGADRGGCVIGLVTR
jgi:hypothetical protein